MRLHHLLIILILIPFTGQASSFVQTPSKIDLGQQQIRYDNTTAMLLDEFTNSTTTSTPGEQKQHTTQKSPGKAFALSMLVPGLGQYYNGSKVTPFAFFGVEVAAWIMHAKYQSDGNDLTDQYEAFNRAHYSEDRYLQYLQLAYNTTDEEYLKNSGTRGFSHSLPDDKNAQQYFELCGKYDQFAWGWEDAYLVVDGTSHTLATLGSVSPVPLIDVPPTSALREQYETMRNDANNAFDRGTKMLYVVIANHMISGFEALFAARKHNKQSGQSAEEFSKINVTPRFRSIYSYGDTPTMVVRVRF